MTNISARPISTNTKSVEPEIICFDKRPRIEPGEYPAFSRAAKLYRDQTLKRWVCMISFDILADNLLEVVARRVPMFFGLGDAERPKAGRRTMFYYTWTLANGAPPRRLDRTSPRVFVNRMARVVVRDTKRCIQDARRAIDPYSVIEKVLDWETGPSGVHLINRSTNQGRHDANCLARGTSKESMSTIRPFIMPNEGTQQSALAGVGHHNTTQGDGRQNPSAVQRHDAAPGQSRATSLFDYPWRSSK